MQRSEYRDSYNIMKFARQVFPLPIISKGF